MLGAGAMPGQSTDSVFLRRRYRGSRRRRWFAEPRFFNLGVQLDFVDQDFALLRRGGRVRIDFKWKLQAVDFAIIAEEILDLNLFVFDAGGAVPLEHVKRRGIDIVGARFAGLAGQLNLVGSLAFDVALARQLDLVAFGFVVDQRPVEIGFIVDVLQVFGGHGLRGVIFRKGIDGPAGGFAVIRANQRLPAEGDFHVQLQGPLQLDYKRPVRARTEGDGAGDALGLDGFEPIHSAARGDGLGDDFVGRLRGSGQREKGQKHEDGWSAGGHLEWRLASCGGSSLDSLAILSGDAASVKCVAWRIGFGCRKRDAGVYLSSSGGNSAPGSDTPR